DKHLRTERLENCLRIVKIRAGLIDAVRVASEIGCRFCTDFRNLRIDGALPKVGAVGDPSELWERLEAIDIGYLGRRETAGIDNVRPCHHIEEQGRIADIARHRPFHRIGGKGKAERPVRDPLRRRPEADDTGKAGRRAEAATKIAALREPDLPACQRRRRAARGAARRPAGIPRVCCRPEHLVERLPPAANSRGLDLPTTMPPRSSSRSTITSEKEAIWSLNIGEPSVKRTSFTGVRSLMASGKPCRCGPSRSSGRSFASASAWARARSKQRVGRALI